MAAIQTAGARCPSIRRSLFFEVSGEGSEIIAISAAAFLFPFLLVKKIGD
jgi:hypothetical protein